METRQLGTSDVKITPIIMGTWQAGKSMWVGIEDAETIKAIRAAFDAGITTVDTAEVYGNGHSEEIVAQALSDVRDRKLEDGDHRAKNKLFQGENYKRVQQSLEQLRPIAERHQCTLAQLSLAWLIAQPQTNAIAGARHAEQSSQNAQAAEVKLSGDELQEIDAIGRLVTDPLDNNPVMWDWDS